MSQGRQVELLQCQQAIAFEMLLVTYVFRSSATQHSSVCMDHEACSP